MKIQTPVILFVALSMFGAGCSANPPVATGTPSSQPTSVAKIGSTPDACKLFLQSDATTIFNGAKAKQDASTISGTDNLRTQCSFSADGERIADLQSANLIVRTDPDEAAAIINMKNTSVSFARDFGTTTQSVPQLGDEAVWGGPDLNQLVVRQGSTILILSVSSVRIQSMSAEQQLKISVQAMRNILGRLK